MRRVYITCNEPQIFIIINSIRRVPNTRKKYIIVSTLCAFASARARGHFEPATCDAACVLRSVINTFPFCLVELAAIKYTRVLQLSLSIPPFSPAGTFYWSHAHNSVRGACMQAVSCSPKYYIYYAIQRRQRHCGAHV